MHLFCYCLFEADICNDDRGETHRDGRSLAARAKTLAAMAKINENSHSAGGSSWHGGNEI